jgi:hypothetical protein
MEKKIQKNKGWNSVTVADYQTISNEPDNRKYKVLLRKKEPERQPGSRKPDRRLLGS